MSRNDELSNPMNGDMFSSVNYEYLLSESFIFRLHGLDYLKEALALVLTGGTDDPPENKRGKIHCLIIGDIGTGKSSILLELSKLQSTPVILHGSQLKTPSLFHKYTQTLHSTNFILIEQIEMLDKETSYLLAHQMENNPKFPPVIAVANPPYGKYNPYQTINQNIPVENLLLSCFDLVFLLRNTPNSERDGKVAETILGRRKSESSTHRFIETPSLIIPRLSIESKERIRDLYVLYRQVLSHDFAYPITPKFINSLIRLSEAKSKLHSKPVVTEKEVESIIQIINTSFDQLGAGILNSQHSTQLNLDSISVNIMNIIEVLQNKSNHIKLVDIVTKAREYSINSTEVIHTLNQLVSNGILSSPEFGLYHQDDNFIVD